MTQVAPYRAVHNLPRAIVVAVALCALVTQTALAAEPGETAYNFLNIGTDARAEAMGGAQTGVADGLGGIYYNPAALADAQPGDFSASYVNWVTDIQSGFLAAAWGVGDKGRMGIAAQYLDFGNFRGFDPSGVPTSDFGASDFAVAVHGAGVLGESFSWGLAGRLITESIASESSTAFAADGGVLYHFRDGRTRVGAAVRNAGKQSSNFGGTEKDDLPITAAVGVSHKLHGAPLLFAIDAFKPTDDDAALAAGAEYSGIRSVTFRAGYNTLTSRIQTGSSSDDLAGLTLGAGFLLNRVRIDYAYGSYSELGGAHRFTLHSNF